MTNKDEEKSLIDLSPELTEKLYKYISLSGDKVTPLNVLLITTNLMQIVEKYSKLSGEQKNH